MLKWIGFIIVITLIAAIVTAPSEDKFKKFASEKFDTTACKPYIEYRSYKAIANVFGLGQIKECIKTTGIYDPKTGKTVGNVAIPVYGEKQTYLGLFGKFWKL